METSGLNLPARSGPVFHARRQSINNQPPIYSSWEELENFLKTKYSELTFSKDSFLSLEGQPYSDLPANRISELLHVLNKIRQCYNKKGKFTREGLDIYSEYFTGDKAWFSDSSKSEKGKFKSKLTFKNPNQPGKYIFCPWHGKVKNPQYRIHFSWPVSAIEPLYIVYIGQKITTK